MTSKAKQRAQKKGRKRGIAYNELSQETARQARDLPSKREWPRDRITSRTWKISSAIVLSSAALLRLYAYGLKPLHHDEGVNGHFLLRLVRDRVYQYDPANYHGPTLYYLTVPVTWLFGMNTFSIRLVPAVFGIATVWLILLLRRYIGSVGAITGAALMAVSPGAVYVSRYYIHEAVLVFFTLAIVVAALKYFESTRPLFLVLAAIAAAMLFATKETALISAGVLMIAVISAPVWIRLRSRYSRHSVASQKRSHWYESMGRFGSPSEIGLLVLSAVAAFLIVALVFYSSFFTNAEGVWGAIDTFKIWRKTGTEHHVKEWYVYLRWLWQEEAGLLLLAIVGTSVAFWLCENRFVVFAGLWCVGIIAAYCLIPYKTPWLALNFLPPMAIMGGYAIDSAYRWQRRNREVVLLVAALIVAIGLYQSISLNFYNYDNDKYPYVYAHTHRGLLGLVGEIDRLAQRARTGNATSITITSPDYWPLPWYLRDYKGVGYHGRVVQPREQIVVSSQKQSAEIERMIGRTHRRVGSYVLRPGIDLILYARNEIPQ